LEALEAIEKDKRRVARAYNKKVKAKSFQVGDLIWKTILPIGSKSNKFGKWSPSWEGPYKIVRVCSGNSYMVESLQGQHRQGLLWKILEEVLPKCMARCLKIHGWFLLKSPLAKKWPTNAMSSLDLFLACKLY
jgi:hypothetical protein